MSDFRTLEVVDRSSETQLQVGELLFFKLSGLRDDKTYRWDQHF